MKDSNKAYSFSFSKKSMTASSKTKEATLKLTPEQKEVYSKAIFLVFSRVKDHPKYYTPLLSSDNVTLEGDTLYSNIGNNLIKWYDVNDGVKSAEYITITERNIDGVKSRKIVGFLTGIAESDSIMNVAEFEISEKDSQPYFSSAKLQSRNNKVNGIYLDMSKASHIGLITGRYKIFDSKGKYTSEWESSPEIIGGEIKPENVRMMYSSLDDGGEYYCLFAIQDINNNVYYSDLIRIGE